MVMVNVPLYYQGFGDTDFNVDRWVKTGISAVLLYQKSA